MITPTAEQIKSHGMVFTPTSLVNEMLNKLPYQVFKDESKTFLDNSCGCGAFLFAVLKRKMWWMMKKEGVRLFDAHRAALKTIYGCELDPKNAEECRTILLNGSQSKELRDIVDNNIITANALDPNHQGWSEVGFYWSNENR